MKQNNQAFEDIDDTRILAEEEIGDGVQVGWNDNFHSGGAVNTGLPQMNILGLTTIQPLPNISPAAIQSDKIQTKEDAADQLKVEAIGDTVDSGQ